MIIESAEQPTCLVRFVSVGRLYYEVSADTGCAEVAGDDRAGLYLLQVSV